MCRVSEKAQYRKFTASRSYKPHSPGPDVPISIAMAAGGLYCVSVVYTHSTGKRRAWPVRSWKRALGTGEGSNTGREPGPQKQGTGAVNQLATVSEPRSLNRRLLFRPSACAPRYTWQKQGDRVKEMKVENHPVPMHNGTLCLPPSAAALNLAQEEGLALPEDGYGKAIRSGWR